MAIENQARDDILEQPVQDPSGFLTAILVQQQQYATLRWLCHFDILTKITQSRDGISYGDVAQQAGVPETTLRSIARMAMTSGFLAETPEGHLIHNALSRTISEDRHFNHWFRYIVQQTVPLMDCLIPAVEKWGNSKESTHTAYNIMRDTELPFFGFLKSRPDLRADFDLYMESQAVMHSGTRIDHLLQAFDWASLGDALVVDVGGNSGATSIRLAKAFPALRLIIQDLEEPIESARSKLSKLPVDLSKRIETQEHDFFSPQPVQGAEVYLLRMILHDWKDAEAVKILERLAAAASPNSRILIMDMVLPRPGTESRRLEAALRQKDLAMLHAFNAKEREVEDWQRVLEQADGRLEIKAIRRPDGSQHSVIEARLREATGTDGGSNGVSEHHEETGTLVS
ncbi:MAG: hypothetical protein L6R36_007345 [Xanthoria steineri]|nr:MAG: hypothetical protein L6R36_007345 [Xanthoria steineri]